MNKKAIGFNGMIVSIILIILGIFFMANFITSFIEQTNPSSELLQSKYGLNQSTNSTRTALENIKTSVDARRAEMGSATVNPIEYLFLISKAMFEIPKAIFVFVVDGIVLIPTLIFTGLGGSGAGDLMIFGLSMVIVVMIITLIILTIRFIRTGND